MTAKRFRDWQIGMGWSAAEAARRLGVSADTISNYRRDGVPPRMATIVALAMAALENRLEAL